MKKINKRLITNIRAILAKKDMTMEKLAFESGITKSHLSKVMSGQRNLGMENIDKIADTLGVDVEELFKKNI
jgi:transcriptional regulator with XRE-family HTH domain